MKVMKVKDCQMNRIFNINPITLIMLLLTPSIYASKTGFHIDGYTGYANSRIPTVYKVASGYTTIENKDYAFAGFLSGASLSYQYNLSEKLYIAANISSTFRTTDRTENTASVTSAGDSTTKIKLALDHMFYPTITMGISLNDKTTISFKSGYGREKWSTKLIADTPINVSSDDETKQWLIGAEITSLYNKNIRIGLSTTYSSADELTTINNTTGNTVTLFSIQPKTTTISMVFQYHPWTITK